MSTYRAQNALRKVAVDWASVGRHAAYGGGGALAGMGVNALLGNKSLASYLTSGAIGGAGGIGLDFLAKALEKKYGSVAAAIGLAPRKTEGSGFNMPDDYTATEVGAAGGAALGVTLEGRKAYQRAHRRSLRVKARLDLAEKQYGKQSAEYQKLKADYDSAMGALKQEEAALRAAGRKSTRKPTMPGAEPTAPTLETVRDLPNKRTITQNLRANGTIVETPMPQMPQLLQVDESLRPGEMPNYQTVIKQLRADAKAAERNMYDRTGTRGLAPNPALEEAAAFGARTARERLLSVENAERSAIADWHNRSNTFYAHQAGVRDANNTAKMKFGNDVRNWVESRRAGRNLVDRIYYDVMGLRAGELDRNAAKMAQFNSEQAAFKEQVRRAAEEDMARRRAHAENVSRHERLVANQRAQQALGEAPVAPNAPNRKAIAKAERKRFAQKGAGWRNLGKGALKTALLSALFSVGGGLVDTARANTGFVYGR